MKIYLKQIKIFYQKILYWQRCIEMNSILIFPTNFEYIRLNKALLSERITGIINNQLIKIW